MKYLTLPLLIIVGLLHISCINKKRGRFVFFLHNAFLESHNLDELHPEYGRAAYLEIIKAYEKEGLTVISEKRPSNTVVRSYAVKVNKQIDSLINAGVSPNNITVIGTSKGGYIAQQVSTMANNSNLNFVFIASYRTSDLEDFPEINYCGNVLTIYEKTDIYGISALPRKETSTCNLVNFKEIALNTGLRHGFLFRPMKEWINPSVEWAKGNYQLN